LFAVDLRSTPVKVLWSSTCLWRGKHLLVGNKVVAAHQDRLEFLDIRTGTKRFLNIPEEYHFARFVPTISLNEHNIAFARRNHDRKADILVVDPNTETVRFILKLSSGVGNPFEIVQGENVVALFTYGAGLTVWNINDGALIQTGILNGDSRRAELPGSRFRLLLFWDLCHSWFPLLL